MITDEDYFTDRSMTIPVHLTFSCKKGTSIAAAQLEMAYQAEKLVLQKSTDFTEALGASVALTQLAPQVGVLVKNEMWGAQELAVILEWVKMPSDHHRRPTLTAVAVLLNAMFHHGRPVRTTASVLRRAEEVRQNLVAKSA